MGEHASKSCKQDRTKKVWNLCQNIVFRRIRCRFTFLSFWIWLQFLPGADTLHGNSYPKLIESLMPPFFSGMILVYPQYLLVYPNHKVEESNNGYCCESLNQPTNRPTEQEAMAQSDCALSAAVLGHLREAKPVFAWIDNIGEWYIYT